MESLWLCPESNHDWRVYEYQVPVHRRPAWHPTPAHDQPYGPFLGLNSDVGELFHTSILQACHILEHEDKGMTNVLEVVGTEGATYVAAETLDPTCYRTTFIASQSNS